MVYGIKADTAADITINGFNQFTNQQTYKNTEDISEDIGKDLIYQNGGTLTISGTSMLQGTTGVINLKNGHLNYNVAANITGKNAVQADGTKKLSEAAIILEDSSATITTTKSKIIGSTDKDTTALLVKGTETKTITITGEGSFIGASNSIDNQSTNATVKIEGGSFSQALTGTGKYNISGGSFSTDVSEYVPEEMRQYALTVDGNTTFYKADTIDAAKTTAETNAVAVVYDTNGTTVLKYYTSLQSAGSNAKAGETITLRKDDSSSLVTASTNWTLDLNGHTWTSGISGLTIKDGATFTLKDSAGGGKLVSGTDVNKYGLVYVEAGGTFNMTGGSIESNAIGVWVLENGVFNMNGGTILNTAETYIDNNVTEKSIGVRNYGTFTLNDSTIGAATDNKSYVGVNNVGGTFSMAGGTVYGTYAGVFNATDGTFTLADGTISGANGVITTGAATVSTMNGGTLNGTDYGVSVSQGSTFNFNGGKIESASYGVGVFNTNSSLIMTDGSIEAVLAGVITNGSESNTNIKISGGSVPGRLGIYNPAVDSTVEISQAEGKTTTITGSNTGIEMRGGSLTVTGGTVTGNGSTFKSGGNTSGSTTSGAGIAIAQHGTVDDIKVTVTNGNISGTVALSITNPNGIDDEDAGKIDISVGSLNGSNASVFYQDERTDLDITGGSFDGAFVSKYSTTTDDANKTIITFPAEDDEDVSKATLKNLSVTGGATFTDESYLPAGYVPKSIQGGGFTVEDVAKIGTTNYTSLKEAINAATSRRQRIDSQHQQNGCHLHGHGFRDKSHGRQADEDRHRHIQGNSSLRERL